MCESVIKIHTFTAFQMFICANKFPIKYFILLFFFLFSSVENGYSCSMLQSLKK